MDNAGAVYVFQTTLYDEPEIVRTPRTCRGPAKSPHKDLVEKVLDKLLFKRPTRQQPVQIRPQKLRDKVDILQRRDKDVVERNDVVMLEVFQQTKFAECAFGENRRRERLQDLLDG